VACGHMQHEREGALTMRPCATGREKTHRGVRRFRGRVTTELILKAFDARHTDIARLVYSMYPTTSSVRASTTASSTTSETAGASWSRRTQSV
jgi:hypothetical protein